MRTDTNGNPLNTILIVYRNIFTDEHYPSWFFAPRLRVSKSGFFRLSVFINDVFPSVNIEFQ